MITFSFNGTSHGEGYTGTICGIPKGVTINVNNINNALATRKGGFGRSDRQKFVDIVTFDGHQNQTEFITDGTNLQFFVANSCVETRPNITAVRTGHADLVGTIRHPDKTAREIAEITSARNSLCYVVLGCVCEQILKDFDICTTYFVRQIGNVCATDIPQCDGDGSQFDTAYFPCANTDVAKQMVDQIDTAKQKGDSLGGVVCVMAKVPAGIGEIFPYHKKLDAQLSAHLMGIPSVKGVTFGMGSKYASQTGVTSHDELQLIDGQISYKTNNCGGIVGGVTTGQNVVINLIVKPVPTVKGVNTIDTQTLQVVPQHYERADICVVPNVGFIAKHIVNYVLTNQILLQYEQNPAQLLKNTR